MRDKYDRLLWRQRMRRYTVPAIWIMSPLVAGALVWLVLSTL